MSAPEFALCITVIGALIVEAVGLYVCWLLWRKEVDQCHK